MKDYIKNINLKKFFLNIILPTVLTIMLFIVLIFSFIVPYFEQNMLNSKKEMIGELVATAISIASRYEQEAANGLITDSEAKSRAISRIEHLRYGVDNKDYFWITDMNPVMIMHPYRVDLNGKDLIDFKDPNGKRLFVEMVSKVKHSGEGYVDYMWQWMDDSTNIVPKISYVKKFQPWGWVIGTGIYIEDVRREISAIEKKLIIVLLGISGIMALLLTMIVRQNLKAEIKRNQAEDDLKISREKYKALVEASTEGTGMFLGGVCIYANKKLLEILEKDAIENIINDPVMLIDPTLTEHQEMIKSFFIGDSNYLQIETKLLRSGGETINVLLSISRISLSEKNGFIIVVKELTAEKEDGREMSEWGIRLLGISKHLGFGIFSAAPERKGRLTNVNDQVALILGFNSKEEVLKINLIDMIENDQEKSKFISEISKNSILTNYPLHIRKQNGLYAVISISAVIEHDAYGSASSIQGIMKDITEQKTFETLKDDMYADIQVSMQLMNQQVKNIAGSIVSCELNLSVEKAAILMTSFKADALLIRSDNEYIGIVTDHDFRERVLSHSQQIEMPIYKFMSSPLVRIPDTSAISDAVSIMQKKEVNHLVVTDAAGVVTGILSKDDLLKVRYNTSEYITDNIRKSTNISELEYIQKQVPLYVRAIIDSGARSSTITKSITVINDNVTAKLVGIIIDELGTPPVPYSFIALGSEGREEQTLLTDQDNAIIYEDVDETLSAEVNNYFLRFGERICCLLEKLGYNFCPGNIMAKNPVYCQPLSSWKRKFTDWIDDAEPQNLLDVQIFFDFRNICGDEKLITELKYHVDSVLENNAGFFGHMAHGCTGYKIPLTIFGKIQTADAHTNSINIKNPLRVLVNLVRLYAVQNHLKETNTLKRLKQLYEKNVFSPGFYHDLVYALDFLMLIQFKHQAAVYSAGGKVDNFIELSELNTIEVNTLKYVFSQLSTFQSKIKYDFGIAE